MGWDLLFEEQNFVSPQGVPLVVRNISRIRKIFGC